MWPNGRVFCVKRPHDRVFFLFSYATPRQCRKKKYVEKNVNQQNEHERERERNKNNKKIKIGHRIKRHFSRAWKWTWKKKGWAWKKGVDYVRKHNVRYQHIRTHNNDVLYTFWNVRAVGIIWTWKLAYNGTKLGNLIKTILLFFSSTYNTYIRSLNHRMGS